MAEVRQAHRRGGLSNVDVGALAGLGIDVDEVVGRVEAALGEGALDDRRRPRSRRLAPLSPEVGLVMQAAGRLAAARGDRRLAAHHLLLSLLTRPGPVADTLGRRGVTVASVLAVLDAGRSRARGAMTRASDLGRAANRTAATKAGSWVAVDVRMPRGESGSRVAEPRDRALRRVA